MHCGGVSVAEVSAPDLKLKRLCPSAVPVHVGNFSEKHCCCRVAKRGSLDPEKQPCEFSIKDNCKVLEIYLGHTPVRIGALHATLADVANDSDRWEGFGFVLYPSIFFGQLMQP